MKDVKIYLFFMAFSLSFGCFSMENSIENSKEEYGSETQEIENFKLVMKAEEIAEIMALRLHNPYSKSIQCANELHEEKLEQLLGWYLDFVSVQKSMMDKSKDSKYQMALMVYGPLVAWQILSMDITELMLFGVPAYFCINKALDRDNQAKLQALKNQTIHKLPNLDDMLYRVDNQLVAKIAELAYQAYNKVHGDEVTFSSEEKVEFNREFDETMNRPWYQKLLPWSYIEKIRGSSSHQQSYKMYSKN
ncbi:MAG: hypothetical protein KC505_08125 [Myxococcales bacterium]|nr:hypothetical protein [Myxococcales bacterium]USN51102.1 MAG: hypothetical protein H6731_01450 [Myxococcales bacterium]